MEHLHKLKLQCKTLDREFQARRTFYAKFQKNCGNDEVRITSISFTLATIKSGQAQINLSTDCPGVPSATFHCPSPSWQNIQTSSSHTTGTALSKIIDWREDRASGTELNSGRLPAGTGHCWNKRAGPPGTMYNAQRCTWYIEQLSIDL